MGLQAWASFWIMVLLESLIYMDYTSIAERTNSYTAIMEDIQCHQLVSERPGYFPQETNSIWDLSVGFSHCFIEG
jgi:hypothetical protein